MRRVGLVAASITAIRAAAGVPDRPGVSDGATPEQVLRAARALAHPALPRLIRGFPNIIAELRPGMTAVIFYRAGRLPSALQYGFTGDHAGGLDGIGALLYISDPLARDGSAPKLISPSFLRPAMEAFPGGAAAVLLEEVAPVVPIDDQKPMTVDVPADTQIYDLARRPLLVIREAKADRYSPFTVDAVFRAIPLAVKGVTQLVLVKTAACRDIRPLDQTPYSVDQLKAAVNTNEARWRTWLTTAPKEA
jgi:hypothetical protein